MRCPDVKRRIDAAAGEWDREIVEHLRTCPSCARASQAVRTMRGILEAATKNDPVLPLATVREQVEARARVESKRTKLEKIMSHLKKQYRARPRLVTGFGLAVVAFLFITLVPFTYEQAAGYKITIDSADADTRHSPEVVTAVLSAAGQEGVSVVSVESPDANGLVIVDIPTEIVARRVAATIAKVIELKVEPRIERNIVAVTGSLFAQVRQKITADSPQKVKMQFEDGNIILNGNAIHDALYSTELDDDRVKAELAKVFAAFGIVGDGVDIKVTTNKTESTRTVTIALDGQHVDAAEQGVIELHMGKRQIWAKFDDKATRDEDDDHWDIVKTREHKDSTADSPEFDLNFPQQSLKGHTIIMHIDL
ncbi:anti-sigma factor family protein [Candidatus Zixiibacteriota bacterium]